MSAQRRGEGEGFDGRKKGFACALSSSPSHRWYPHGCPSCVSNCPHHSFPPPPLPPSPPTAAAAKQPSIQERGENRGREKKRKENGKKPSRKKTKGPFVVKKPSFDDRVWDLLPSLAFLPFASVVREESRHREKKGGSQVTARAGERERRRYSM